jgi:hypothetical protein
MIAYAVFAYWMLRWGRWLPLFRCKSWTSNPLMSLALTVPLALMACSSDPSQSQESSDPEYVASLVATLSCRTGETSMPVYACFVAPSNGSSGSVKIQNGGSVIKFSEIDLISGLSELEFNIALADKFQLNLQTSSAAASTLRLEIAEDGDLVFEDEASSLETIIVSDDDL